jgi:hypothetical protein
MANTIFDKSDYETILRRINNLELDAIRHFGSLEINEMLCHVTDQIRLALGYLELPDEGNFFDRTIIKWFALSMKSIPKGKIETANGVNPKKEGTKPVSFIDDKVTLAKLLQQLYQKEEAYDWGKHPKFGALSQKQWGKLIYVHLDHHLKQFSN